MTALAARVGTLRLPALSRRAKLVLALVVIALLAALPLFFAPISGVTDFATKALAYTVMALGLNIVVGFAGLLDLGYVAFFALGAYSIGWLSSGFFSTVGHGRGFHFGVTGLLAQLPGVHFNFVFVLIAAVIITAIAGMIIGLPTLRLRGDYIAIVTLAFGEIIGAIAVNGDQIRLGASGLTAGRQGISPIDSLQVPGLYTFSQLNLRPWYWVALVLVLIVLFVNFRLRDSRLGRAWIAVREDEVAAASMGVPLVKTKLAAYATGAAFGGIAGAFLAAYLNTVNADQFEFSFSIFILAMVILGGLGSIWGVVLGAVALTYINFYLIPNQLDTLPQKLGLNFDLTQLSFGIFGFLLVIVILLRPEGLLPNRRRRQELKQGIGEQPIEGHE